MVFVLLKLKWGTVINYNHIGRGFSVNWKENEKSVIDLSIPIPFHPEKLNDFFDTVKRITDYWKSNLEVDGVQMDFNEFLAKKEEFQKFNMDCVKGIIRDIVSEKMQINTFPCIMFHLTIGKEEAIKFQENVDDFFQRMHDQQSLDAYYAVPKFYQKGDQPCSF